MADKVGIRPAAIVIKDGKVLLVRSKYGEEEFYLFPGGGLEFGETIEEAAIRETFEETGVKIKIKNLFHVNEYISADDWSKRSVSVFFIAEFVETLKPTTDDGGKVKEIKWVRLEELKEYDVRPKKVVEMLNFLPELQDKMELYSVDYVKKS